MEIKSIPGPPGPPTREASWGSQRDIKLEIKKVRGGDKKKITSRESCGPPRNSGLRTSQYSSPKMNMWACGHVGACGIEIVCAGVTIDRRRDHTRLAEERRRRGPKQKTGARRRSGEL